MPEVLKWSEPVCKEAACFGLIYVLEQQKDLKVVSTWSPSIWDAAAANGQVDTLHWALQQPFHVRMDPRKCLIIAAENCHPRCCRWIYRKFPYWFRDYTAMVDAAISGKWAAVRLLCSLQMDPALAVRPPAQPLDIVVAAAAAQGNLEFLQWAWKLRPQTPLQESAIAQAAANGNFHVLEWAVQEPLPAHEHLLWKIFAVAVAHQSSSLLSVMASLGLQVVGPGVKQPASKDLQCLITPAHCTLQQLAVSLTPATKGDPLWQATFKEALWASPWKQPPSGKTCVHSSSVRRAMVPGDAGSTDRYVDLISWLTEMAKLPHPHPSVKRFPAEIEELVEESQSIVPIELAAKGIQPRIPWGPRTHRLAGAYADLETLCWMLQQKRKPPHPNVVEEGCPPARMLRLVEQHGWTLPGPQHLQRAFNEALALRQRCLAFLGVVSHQRKHPSGQTCLGSLPKESLAMIVQEAGLDMHIAPSTKARQVGPCSLSLLGKRQAIMHAQLLCTPVHLCTRVLVRLQHHLKGLAFNSWPCVVPGSISLYASPNNNVINLHNMAVIQPCSFGQTGGHIMTLGKPTKVQQIACSNIKLSEGRM